MPILKETVRPARWFAVIAGFIGVLIIARPGSDLFTAAAIWSMINAVLLSLYQVITRMLSGREHSYTTLVYAALVGSSVSLLGVLMPGGWMTPAPSHMLLIAGMGVLGAPVTSR